jgi:hypothetical protein
MSKEMREQITRVRNWKQFLNESMENEFPNSITIKLNDNGKFSKQFRYGNRTPNGAVYNNNYSMASYGTGLELQNGQYYPLLKLEVKHLEYVYVYVMFDNKLSDNDSKGGGIRIIESPEFIGPDFTRYSSFVKSIDYRYTENCFFPEFTPGTTDDKGYFKIVSVN